MEMIFLYDCYYTSPKGKITRRGSIGNSRRDAKSLLNAHGQIILSPCNTLFDLIPRKRLAYYVEREDVQPRNGNKRGAEKRDADIWMQVCNM